jgi:hypothetical protein
MRPDDNKDEMLTLWLTELALLNTCLQGLVEQRIEHLIGSIDVVVGLDVLLESNTAVRRKRRSVQLSKMRRHDVNKI